MEDKLIVRGVHESIDGEYPCDILGMLTVGHENSMTNRELHKIKVMTGILAGDLMDQINNSDMDASVALAAVILDRNDKTFQDDWLWDAPMGAGITFDIRAAKEKDELPPQDDAPVSTPIGASETSGGVPSVPSSESPDSDPSTTGSPLTDTSAT